MNGTCDHYVLLVDGQEQMASFNEAFALRMGAYVVGCLHGTLSQMLALSRGSVDIGGVVVSVTGCNCLCPWDHGYGGIQNEAAICNSSRLEGEG